MSERMSQGAFYKALESARQPKQGGAHPFSKLWAEGKLSRQQLGQWAVQHDYYIEPIPHATTPELQKSAIATVKASAALRWSMLDGVYSAVVLDQAA